MAKKSSPEADSPPPSKRLKPIDEGPTVDFGLQRDPLSICANGTDGTGFLSVMIFMVWPIKNHKARCNVQCLSTVDFRNHYRFDMEFSGLCAQFFDVELKLHVHDQVDVALKGVQVVKMQKSSGPNSLNMVLKWDEGVMLKFTKRAGRSTDEVVNVWKLIQDSEKNAEYDTDVRVKETNPQEMQAPAFSVQANAQYSGIDWRVSPEPFELPTENDDSRFIQSALYALQPISPKPASKSTAGSELAITAASESEASANLPCDISDTVNVQIPKKPTPLAPSSTYARPPFSINDRQSRQRFLQRIPAAVPVRSEGQQSSTVENATPGARASAAQARSTVSKPQGPAVSWPSNGSSSVGQATYATSASNAANTSGLVPAPLSFAVDATVTTDLAANLDRQKKSKSTIRREKRRRQKMAAQHDDAGNGPSLHDKGMDLSRKGNVAGLQSNHEALTSIATRASQVEDEIQALAPVPPAVPAFQAGFESIKGGTYAPLHFVQCGARYNVVGVVTTDPSPQPYRTITGDLTVSFMIVDPSNFDSAKSMDELGLRINCFTKNWESWLPPAKYGDIIILRKIWGSDHKGTVIGVGYKDKLEWALYDPSAHASHHGPPGDSSAPRAAGLAEGGGGFVFSPFWNAHQDELEYCKRLKEWWEACEDIRRKEDAGKAVVQAGVFSLPRTVKRCHRLICDAGPNVEPNGFFDCTVEVLHGHMNDNGVYSLYVTDYTANNQMETVSAYWCDPLLSDRVLKIEMWDEATTYAKENMQPGDYYSMRNNRMKVAHSGYVEGTMTYPEKIRKLDEGQVWEGPFKELLERKKKWKEDAELAWKSNGFQHMLLEDVGEETGFFNCTVEVLHVETQVENCLYVTDYTKPSIAARLPPGANQSWAENLTRLIFKITLRDGQENAAEQVECGEIYSIRKVRGIMSVVEGQFQGRLGGTDRLIKVLGEGDEKGTALLQRKEKWRQDLQRQKSVARCAADESPRQPRAARRRKGYSTIGEIIANRQFPNKYRLVARVVDYAPLHLEDCVVIKCTGCHEEIKAPFRNCRDCDDEPLDYFYRFLFELQDEEGALLKVGVADADVCNLLQGLRAADLHEDQDALREFKARLQPLIGNLEEYHDGIEFGGRFVRPNTPLLRFVIDSWTLGENKHKYGLVQYTTL